MPTSISSRYVLDQSKRGSIIALIANGSSRRVAARFVGCAPATITRMAARDPEFAEQLAHAEHKAEIKLLRSVQIAANDQKYWRAAAWLLERRNPEDFAARGARLFTAQQVSDMFTRLLVEQLKQFPLAEHDDGPDALEMAIRLAAEMVRGVCDDGLGNRLRIGT